ncbi:MAG: hemin ABC transporter substrate-binding protein [Rhodobacterales bacterium]|nr:MAG: hemin ABC transporter substrate-binding protein [Rhodobacterales bacterium]
MKTPVSFFWARAGLGLLMSIIFLASAQVGQADQPANRIVSVGGAVTEIIYALGEEDRLVGRDTTSNFPAAALELPDVGYIRRLSPEGILSVNPDMLIAEQGAGPVEAVQLLREAAIPLIEIPEGYTADAVTNKITAVADVLGVPEKGAVLAEQVRSELEAAAAMTEDMREKRVLFILTMAGGRVMVGGQNTAAQGIIELAGASNAATGFEGYKPMTDEAIIESRADVILLMDRGDNRGVTDEQLFSHPAISGTPAGQTRTVIRMDGMKMLGFSVRTAEAITELSRALKETGR